MHRLQLIQNSPAKRLRARTLPIDREADAAALAHRLKHRATKLLDEGLALIRAAEALERRS